ncbi:MAG: hypothetical protein ABI644_11030 [Arenimonas sp.]
MSAFLNFLFVLSIAALSGCSNTISNSPDVTFRTFSRFNSESLPKIAKYEKPQVTVISPGNYLVLVKTFTPTYIQAEKIQGWMVVTNDKTIFCYTMPEFEESSEDNLSEDVTDTSAAYDLFLEYRVSHLPAQKLKNVAVSNECKPRK